MPSARRVNENRVENLQHHDVEEVKRLRDYLHSLQTAIRSCDKMLDDLKQNGEEVADLTITGWWQMGDDYYDCHTELRHTDAGYKIEEANERVIEFQGELKKTVLSKIPCAH
jgi:hypothetical protein